MPEPATHITPELLYEDLVELVMRVEALDVRELEGSPAPKVWGSLFVPVTSAIDAALSVLTATLSFYDGEEEPPAPPPTDDEWNRGFDLGVDTLVCQQPSRARVADLAFMASFELRQKKDALARLDVGDDGWRLLEMLDGGRRRVRKTLTAVAAMLAQVESLEHRVGFASEIETSLKTRQAYAKLLRSIDEAHEPDDEALHARLRGIGTQIAMLVGRRVYADLRVGDRFQIRALQARILDWLRTYERGPEAFLSGRRLWQDLAGFGRGLAMVSQRQELLEHDAHVLTVARASLCGRSERTVIPAPVLERIATLRGLDEELDRLLDEGAEDVPAVCAVLERLQARLVRAAPARSVEAEPIAWEEL